MASAITGRQRPLATVAAFQKILDENAQLIQTIGEFNHAGRVTEAQQLQQLLHRNLIQLATVADSSLLPELQIAPLSEAQPSAPQANSQRRESNAVTPNEQLTTNAASFPSQQPDAGQAVPNSTLADKENRPTTAPYASPVESRALGTGAGATGPYFGSAENQAPHHQQAPGHVAQYDQHPVQPQQQQQPVVSVQSYGAPNVGVQAQQPMPNQHMAPPQQPVLHQGPPQQPTPIQHQHSQPPQQNPSALQQQLQQQPPHPYYGQPQYQQSMSYQQQMVGTGGANYPSMAQPVYPASAPMAAQQQQQAPQTADGGYYSAPQQRYQYPMATAPAGQRAMYQQQPMPPPTGQAYPTSAYQQQPTRQPTSAYGPSAAGYGYQQQPGGNVDVQQPQPQQMGPPQSYPQYHQGNFPQPQVTSAQQMHYQTPNASA